MRYCLFCIGLSIVIQSLTFWQKHLKSLQRICPTMPAVVEDTVVRRGVRAARMFVDPCRKGKCAQRTNVRWMRVIPPSNWLCSGAVVFIGFVKCWKLKTVIVCYVIREYIATGTVFDRKGKLLCPGPERKTATTNGFGIIVTILHTQSENSVTWNRRINNILYSSTCIYSHRHEISASVLLMTQF